MFCSNPDHSFCEATIYCSMCKKFYCADCENKVHSKLFSDHTGFVTHDIASAGMFTGKCKFHSEYPLDYFCKTHSCLCCTQCQLSGGYHSRCHVRPFSEVSPEHVQRLFTRTTHKLERLVASAEKFSREGLLRKQEAFEHNVQSVKDEIRRTFQGLREMINARESELLAAADQFLSDHSSFGAEEYVYGLDHAAATLAGMRRLDTQFDAPSTKEAAYMVGEGCRASSELGLSLKSVVESLCKGASASVAFGDSYSELEKLIGSFGNIRLDLVSAMPTITVEEVFTDKIALSWNPAPFDAVYKIKMSNAESGFVNLYKGRATMCAVGDLEPDTEYSLWIQIKVNGVWSGLGGPTTVRTLLPPGPSQVVGKPISSNQIYLQWEKVPDATGYCLEMKGEGEGEDAVFRPIYTGLKASFIKDVVGPNEGYTFHVRAQYGDRSSSMWSEEVLVRTAEEWTCAWSRCPPSVAHKRMYRLADGNPRIATKMNRSHDIVDYQNYATIIGSNALPLGRVLSWRVKILKSKKNNGKLVFVGVAPHDIDQNAKLNYVKSGWYLYCGASTLWSGPPQNYDHVTYGPRKDYGGYVGTGDSVGVVMDTKKGELSFVLRSVNYGVGLRKIPLDKPLVPCVLAYHKYDSFEIITLKKKK